MAGMDWFRWHHGSVTDPKFQLVAKKAGVKPAEVLAVWACLLEEASQAEDRGNPGTIDFEAIDCLLGLDEGTTERIYQRMAERGLFTAEGRVEAWERRQPKREREDDTAAERKRRQRAREAEEDSQSGTGSDFSVTPSHTKSHQEDAAEAASHQKTPRGEKRRVEKKRGAKAPLSADALPTWMQALIDLYHEVLPELPGAVVMNAERDQALRDFRDWVLSTKRPDGTPRATTDDEMLSWTRDYFDRARHNDFIMGRGPKSPEHKNWRCSIEFLLSSKGMQKVIEQTEVPA